MKSTQYNYVFQIIIWIERDRFLERRNWLLLVLEKQCVSYDVENYF